LLQDQYKGTAKIQTGSSDSPTKPHHSLLFFHQSWPK
jgi:hypothetical protein